MLFSLLLETKKTEEKPYKTTYSMPKDSKFEQDNSFSKKLSHSDQNKDIKRLRDRLLAEFKAPNHIISELLSRFSELFLNKYLIFFSVDPKSNLEMLCESFKMDIRLLFGLMKDMIEKWYLSIIVQNPALAKNRHKRQEFLDSLINMTVFSNGNNIYYVLLSLYGLVYNISEKRLDRSMELLKGIKPENMEINPVFCLKKCKVPYGNVINSINEQSSIISATEKFQVICRIKEEIKDSIETYWEEWDPNIPAQKLMIDSDQLLTIVAFCIIKSQNCKLLSYLGFIRDFGNKNQMQNSYYFTTYDAALSYLLKLEESDIEAILKEDILKQND